MSNQYNTIDSKNSLEFKDRGSKFIGYCFPINSKIDFKQNLIAIKILHPKASHFCFAYRLGFDKTDFRSSDAGEPNGTAGKPILGQIDSKELTNILIIVVRYFGGTLLGVPGLINAYKTTASMLLQTTVIITKEITKSFLLEYDYTKMNEVLKIIKQFRGEIISNNSSLFSIISINLPIIEMDMFKNKIIQINGLVLKEIL